mmetsp:Transcript_110431/g.219520  ORF Transcript_110431/g.219520 Transcript_110431/m.219520 type:complete len:148 (+) Transcript_110431:152-595(+)|eukprot:CAMPEP_0172665938 /NCGR_PEP_ID=MMETSP1074-20121228/7532_1 /TAXON_ID=2916 /ORGANISM="Ceratium fusus, Strain PA161109" /LENGTH=147 /DNA_ID=CAMNT_0013482291 /DNA_START=135 /DNA_END=578 /DNA_ORIENTATION=+
MSDSWAWGVQQRLSRTCAPEVTTLVQCCRGASLDVREVCEPVARGVSSGDGCRACATEHDSFVRCASNALLQPEFKHCQKSFQALHDDDDASSAALAKAWRCAWAEKHFRKPLEQLVVQAQAVGECRSAGPVAGAGAKSRWTAGGVD